MIMTSEIKVKAGENIYNTRDAHLLFNPFHHAKNLVNFNTVKNATDTHFTCEPSCNLNEAQALINYYQVIHQSNRYDLNGTSQSLHVIHDRADIVSILDARFNQEKIKHDQRCKDKIKELKEIIADAQREIDSLNNNGLIFNGASVNQDNQDRYDQFIAKLDSKSL
jgi:hypothetical protein